MKNLLLLEIARMGLQAISGDDNDNVNWVSVPQTPQ